MQRITPLTAIFRPNLKPDTKTQLAWAVLRVVVGVVMVHNGLDKLADIDSFAQAYVEYIGLPFPIFFSYVAAFISAIYAACFFFFTVNGAGSVSVDALVAQWLQKRTLAEQEFQRQYLEKSYQTSASDDATEVGTGIK